MDTVFVLTRRIDGKQEYITSSQYIFDIIDAMYNQSYGEIHDFNIYVTEWGRNSIPYKEWRNE